VRDSVSLIRVSTPSRLRSIFVVPEALLPKNVKVLGDRVRCDVRYQELKLPESEYRAFFKRCMGTPAEAGLKDLSNEHALKAKEEPLTPPALQNAMKELSNATKLALKMQQVPSDARAH
jgi:hypothetical protein